MKKHGTTKEGTTSNGQRGMQEFVKEIPAQAATLREKLVGVTEESAVNRQRAKEKNDRKTRSRDEDWKARSMWEMLGNVSGKESEQERGWNPLDDHTPMEDCVPVGSGRTGLHPLS